MLTPDPEQYRQSTHEAVQQALYGPVWVLGGSGGHPLWVTHWDYLRGVEIGLWDREGNPGPRLCGVPSEMLDNPPIARKR